MIALTLFVAKTLLTTRPTAKRRQKPKSAPVVSVMTANLKDHQVIIPVMGTIEPELEISLTARVSGEITEVHPEFLAGGVVEKGEILVVIDPVDYLAQVAQAEAQLEQARLDLQLEEGKQIIAEKEWKLMGSDQGASDLEKELVLRKPQLRRVKATVKSAEASLKKARADLNRTRVKAPFNAVVRSISADIGDQASPQKTLATLIGTDMFHVVATLSVDRLSWLEFPSEANPFAGEVLVESVHSRQRTGHLKKLLTDVEPGGRMARILVEIPDPLGLESDQPDPVPLLIGEYIQAGVAGRTVQDVYELPRNSLRENNIIWIITEENKLGFAPVDIIWRDQEMVLVQGLAPQTQIIVSDLSSPVEGMELTLNIPGAQQRDQGETSEKSGKGRP